MSRRRADALFNRGRFHRARRYYLLASQDDPSDVSLRSAVIVSSAWAHEMSFAQAEAEVRELAGSSAGQANLQNSAAVLRFADGDHEGAINELRRLVDAHPTDPKTLSALAGSLPLPESGEEAWTLFQRALALGPLESTCYRFRAFSLAHRLDPAGAASALKGTKSIERASIRTRALGSVPLGGVFLALVIVVMVLGGSKLLFTSVVAASTTTFALWVAYANDWACCKACRNAWIGLAVLPWVPWAFAALKGSAGVLVGWVLLIAVAAWEVINARMAGSLSARSADSRNGSTSVEHPAGPSLSQVLRGSDVPFTCINCGNKSITTYDEGNEPCSECGGRLRVD